MNHLFVINPAAGKGKALKRIAEIREYFSHREDNVTIETTQRAGHATEIVKRYVSQGTYRVYSLGGDGTLNEVLNGLVGSSSSLAVVPSGSGNDFIRNIVNDPEDLGILEKTINGTEVLMDIARVNNRYFISISSVGFDAEVVFNAVRFKKKKFVSGKFAYLLSVITTLFGHKGVQLKVWVDDHKFEMKTLLCAVANGKFYGGGMMPCPDASIYDGELDICLVRDIGRFKILRLFPKYMKGKHLEIKEVSMLKGRKIEIECDREISLNIDGEIEISRKMVYEVIPKGLKIVIPSH
ncbi:MAG: diacylglycerol kinase family lipid kinase [Clostridia bacterium]|nr:diacylglycerol kinase family lipid kinase [Clostridia bacterium]